MRFLLDTSAFLKAALDAGDLTKKARKIILDPENLLELSAISLIEIHIKRTLGKIDLAFEDLHRAIEDLQLKILPLTASHCREFERLPPHPRDPFDRIIIAQALAESIPVLSSDAAFASTAV